MEFGLLNAILFDNAYAYPKTAGIQYEWEYLEQNPLPTVAGGKSPGKTFTVHISNAKLLRPDCQYEEMQDEKAYFVLTNSYLAEGRDGYSIFKNKASAVAPTGVSETQSFWFHAHSTCRVDTQYKTQQERQEEIEAAETKMLYIVDTMMNPNLNRTRVMTKAKS